MSDFYSRLEEQLVAAGRRRQTRGQVASAVAGRGRALAAVAVVLAVLIAGLAVTLPVPLTTSTTDETLGPMPAMSVAAPTTTPPTATAPAENARLAGIRVAVFNATGLPQLARNTAETLRAQGAYVALFGSGRPRSRTIIRYVRGAESNARRVASFLGVVTIGPHDESGAEPIPPETARASVIVVVGYDRKGAAAP